MRLILLLAALSLLTACETRRIGGGSADDDDSGDDDDATADPGEDPEIDEVVTWLFAHVDAGTEAQVAYGLRQLEELLAPLDPFAPDPENRGLSVAELTSESLSGLEHPGLPLEDAVGVGLLAWSDAPLGALLELELLEDRVPIRPSSPETHDRFFLASTELCFPSGDCPLLARDEFVLQNIILGEVPGEHQAQVRQVDAGLLPPSEGGGPSDTERPALIGRAWAEESAWDADGARGVLQSFALTVSLPSGTGYQRLAVTWSDTEFGADIDEALELSVRRSGLDQQFQAEEQWMLGR